MLFRVRHHVSYGTRVCLTGSTPALGSWQVQKAIPCKWHQDDIWETSIDPLLNDSKISPPTRLEFKFLLVTNSHPPQWEPGQNHALVIPAGVDPSTDSIVSVTWASSIETTLPGSPQSKSPPSSASQFTRENGNGAHPVHTTFRLNVKLSDGERAYVVGSSSFLGSWNKMHAPRLEPVKEGVYETNVYIDTSTSDDVRFEYKYFIRAKDGSRRWEKGLNRLANLSEFDSAVKSDVLLWDDHWEKTRLEFSIYFPSSQDSQRMHITGDPLELGAWHKPGPTPMLLGPEQQLETDVVGRKWYLKVWVPITQRSFPYRYVVIDSKSHAELWEREPNRHADLNITSSDRDSKEENDAKVDDKQKSDQPVQVHAVNSVTVFKDVNFVSAMKFDEVPDDMFIGPYPQTEEDVDILAEAGVTAVLNVQTDEDFEHRGVEWDKLTRKYEERDILIKRYQIRDFDRDSLKSKLNGGAHALDDLLKQGRKVYVHCTAGMGRAPAVVVAYLCWVRKMSLDAAVSHVKKHRTVAVPNIPVLEQVLKQSY